MNHFLKLINRGAFGFAVLAMFAVQSFTAAAQQKAPPASPPAKDSISLGGKWVSVAYSSPAVKGRDIFSKSGLISHDVNYPIWRAGANSATAFHTDADVTIGSLTVPAGNYTLFVNIANPDKWELVVNKQTGQWGLTYKPEMDLGRVPMTMSKPAAMAERLNYKFVPAGNKMANLTLTWENHSATVHVMSK